MAALIIWALIAAAPGVQGDAGSDFLNEKEMQVVLVAKQVEVNDAQTCGKQRDYCNYCGISLSLSLPNTHTHTHTSASKSKSLRILLYTQIMPQSKIRHVHNNLMTIFR